MSSRTTSLSLIAVLSLTLLSRTVAAPPAPLHQYAFRHDGVLGTSLDLSLVATDQQTADRAEAVALAEIERLRRILSSWDSASEISRLTREGRLAHPSPELLEVLAQYDHWHEVTGGAYSARVGALTPIWAAAAAANRLPDPAMVADAAREARSPGWRIDPADGSITALTAEPIDLNSLGKGYILDHAVAALRAAVPEVRGGLVNIGGDVQVWGMPPDQQAQWRIGVVDPAAHADNAEPRIRVALDDHAISSSGNYARGFDIAGRHYSHILDPRTGYPAEAAVGVTVIAGDNATANALATSLSVLGPAEGMRLVRELPGVEALWILPNGGEVRSPGFAAFEQPVAVPVVQPAVVSASIEVDLTPAAWNRRRPYVAVWITDTTGAHVKTLAFWGDHPRYQRELSKWWGAFSADRGLVDAVTRATRPVGVYTFDWDGTNQAGEAVAAGTYVFWLESSFEHGAHSLKSVAVPCGGAAATGEFGSAAAFAGGQVACGPARAR